VGDSADGVEVGEWPQRYRLGGQTNLRPSLSRYIAKVSSRATTVNGEAAGRPVNAWITGV